MEPSLPETSGKDVPENVSVAASLKSTVRLCALPLAVTPRVNAAALSVKLTVASFAFACDVAFPVKDNVNCVEESRVSTNVNPEGTPVTAYCVPAVSVDTKVSLDNVTVRVCVMEPLLAAASGNVVPEKATLDGSSKSMLRDEMLPVAVTPRVNAAAFNVKLTLLVSLALA
jgi:hypothetical protein